MIGRYLMEVKGWRGGGGATVGGKGVEELLLCVIKRAHAHVHCVMICLFTDNGS